MFLLNAHSCDWLPTKMPCTKEQLICGSDFLYFNRLLLKPNIYFHPKFLMVVIFNDVECCLNLCLLIPGALCDVLLSTFLFLGSYLFADCISESVSLHRKCRVVIKSWLRGGTMEVWLVLELPVVPTPWIF